MYFQDWFIVVPTAVVGFICLPIVLVLAMKFVTPEIPDQSADEDDVIWGASADDFEVACSMYVFDGMPSGPWGYNHFHSYSRYQYR